MKTQTLNKKIMNSEQPVIVGLDIGTTKIAAIAGRKNEFGKIEILGFGRSNSNGVKHAHLFQMVSHKVHNFAHSCFDNSRQVFYADFLCGHSS